MMYSNVIAGITISRVFFVFSQSRVEVSTSITTHTVGSLPVGESNIIIYALYVVGFVPVLNVGQYLS